MVDLDIQLPVRPEAVGMARDRLEPLGREIEDEVWENVRLLVSELVTNSIRHAGLRTDAHVELSVDVDEEQVRVCVTDQGRGFRPPDGSQEPGLEGGWGLYLVDRISDRWGVRIDGSTQVWFEIDRPS